MESEKKIILSVRELVTEFVNDDGTILRAVDGIDIDIKSNEIYGLVGESGCGKTISSLSIMRLVKRPGIIKQGEVLWEGNDLLSLTRSDMRQIRGREIAMIFQHPQAALNPLYSIGDQLSSIVQLQQRISKKQAEKYVVKYLDLVKLHEPEKIAKKYPHQLSGGQCQRIMIAMAISCRPKLIIADEPTSALDVTIQDQILNLLLELRQEFGMSILLISHDMGVVANMCDRLSVMYLGKIVEEADTESLFSFSLHPYTKILLNSVPIPEPGRKKKRVLSFNEEGIDFGKTDTGCNFRARCPKNFDRCVNAPDLRTINESGGKVACWLYHEN